VRAPQLIRQICARFVKLSNRGASEFDGNRWIDGGRKFDGFRGHCTLRSGKERQSEYVAPPRKRAIGAIGQRRKTGTLYEIRSTKPQIGTIGRPREGDTLGGLGEFCRLPCSSVLSAAEVTSPTISPRAASMAADVSSPWRAPSGPGLWFIRGMAENTSHAAGQRPRPGGNGENASARRLLGTR